MSHSHKVQVSHYPLTLSPILKSRTPPDTSYLSSSSDEGEDDAAKNNIKCPSAYEKGADPQQSSQPPKSSAKKRVTKSRKSLNDSIIINRIEHEIRKELSDSPEVCAMQAVSRNLDTLLMRRAAGVTGDPWVKEANHVLDHGIHLLKNGGVSRGCRRKHGRK